MKKKLTNNLLLKILSLVIAFGLWIIVINIDDPVDEKSFSNIKVNLVNTNVLTEQNKVYEVINNTDSVRVRVEASRSLLESLSSADIMAEADFTKMAEDETVEINFYSLRSNEAIRNISGSISKVELNVENKKTKRLVLNTETQGEPMDGYVVGTINMDQNRVEVSGPESIISRISSAVLQVDISDSSSEISTYADVILYDVDGKEVSSKQVTMNTGFVKVTIPILKTKEVPVSVETTGVPAEGYGATGVVEQSVSKVTIAGEDRAISGINKIVIPAEDMDITGSTQNFVKTYSIKKYLPENVVIVSDTGKITVTVYIESKKEVLFKVPAEQVYIMGVPEGYTAEPDENVDEFNLYLFGMKKDLDEIKADEIQGYIQVDNWMESEEMEKLEPGIYLIPVEFNFEGEAEASREVKATVSIKLLKEK